MHDQKAHFRVGFFYKYCLTMLTKSSVVITTAILLSGCSTIQKYWPRAHDPVMLSQLVALGQDIDAVDCKKPYWHRVLRGAEHLDRYVALRQDPQQENIHALNLHVQKMSENANPTFCELGKKTAKRRIDTAGGIWGSR
jgi:hypothetical protein